MSQNRFHLVNKKNALYIAPLLTPPKLGWFRDNRPEPQHYVDRLGDNKCTPDECDNKTWHTGKRGVRVGDKTISDLSEEVAARNCLVQAYRATKVKSVRKQRTTRSVRMLHKKFSYFVKPFIAAKVPTRGSFPMFCLKTSTASVS